MLYQLKCRPALDQGALQEIMALCLSSSTTIPSHVAAKGFLSFPSHNPDFSPSCSIFQPKVHLVLGSSPTE